MSGDDVNYISNCGVWSEYCSVVPSWLPHQVPCRDTYLVRHINPPFGEKFPGNARVVPGVIRVSWVNKSDCITISGELGGVALSFLPSKIGLLCTHSHALASKLSFLMFTSGSYFHSFGVIRISGKACRGVN